MLAIGAPRRDKPQLPRFDFDSAAIDRGINGIGDLRRIVAERPFDVAHIHGLLRVEHSLWAREMNRAGIPYVVTPRNIFNPYTMQKRAGSKRDIPGWRLAKMAYLRLFDSSVMSNATAVHVLSPYEANLAAQYGARRLFIHPYGIDPPPQPRETESRTSIEGPVRFLFLGRLDVFQKGLDLIADAFSRMDAEENFIVKVAGPPAKGSAEFLRDITAVVPPNALEMCGRLDGEPKEAAFAEAHYLLHPSRWEVMARTAREALARGVPIIASEESNLGHWARTEHLGFDVDLSSGSLEAALRRAISGRGEHAMMAQNAQAFAKDHSWDHLATALVEVYEGKST